MENGTRPKDEKVQEFEDRLADLERSVDFLVEAAAETAAAAKGLVGFVKSVIGMSWGHKLSYLVVAYEIYQAHADSPASIVATVKRIIGG